MSTDLPAALALLRKKRGYLLPHHGLMALSMPNVMHAYDALYTELALNERVLSRREHEFVWLAVLIACDESIGSHHIERFRVAGGTQAELQDIVALTAMALGIEAGLFVDRHWQTHLPGFDARAVYFSSFEKVLGDASPALAHMAAAAVCVCKGNWDGLRWHIIGAYDTSADEHELAEALSLTLFPGSVPNFVEAADVWRELILSGDVEASADFRAWAELSGQGGFDEAVGKANE